MALYKINKNKVQSVKEQKFKLEKDIQTFVENNLEELFGLQFVATERKISGLYIDTLAYDSENKAFIIIEYKRDSSFSVVDQGFSYLSLMVNNKADFVLEFNEKKNMPLRKGEVDWSQSKVLFIAPTFTTHQINAVNFKNMPFELWEIKRYEGEILSLELINSEGSSEEAPNILETKETSKVTREVKTYTEKDYFATRLETRETYKVFKERLLESYPELIFDVKSGSINIKHRDNWRVVVYVNAYMDNLRLVFTRSRPEDFIDPQKNLVYKSESVKNKGQDLSYMKIHNNNEEDLEYGIDLFRQAYKRFRQEFIEG